MRVSNFVTLLANVTWASVINANSNDGSVNTRQLAAESRSPKGAPELQKAYNRYAKRDAASGIVAATQSGEVLARPVEYDTYYLSDVYIGTPAKVYNLSLDTGTRTTQIVCPKKKAKRQMGGYYIVDNVTIGGVTADNQAIYCVNSADPDFVGTVGLAFPVPAEKRLTYWQNIAGKVAVKTFAANPRKQQDGTFDIGVIDSNHYSGSIVYTPVDSSNGFWSFKVTSYTISGTTFNTAFNAIADTGTSLILLPDLMLKQYYSKVLGARNDASQGGWIFPCSANLPPLSLNIGGRTATVPGSYINYAPIDRTTCFGGLQSSYGIQFNILGLVFLKSQYVVFDFGVPQIGFATKK